CADRRRATMSDNKRIVLLVLIMTVVAGGIGVTAIAALYEAAFEEERLRLVETAHSQARLMEAVARFDQKYSFDYAEGPREATIAQLRDAHEQYLGFGETGEFTLARRDGDDIVFVLRHRHSDLDIPEPVPYRSTLAEPMRRALSGQSGTVIGPDYRGVTVLAAYEPVAVLDLGIVAKIDLAEIRVPFLRAAGIVVGIAIVLIAGGTMLFFRVSNPIRERTNALVNANESLQQQIDARREAEEELRYSLRDQEIIASILRDSLRPVSLDEILWQALSLVLTRHEMELEHKGCIFLVDTETEELVLKVREGLPDSILDSCGRVPFGQCLCGLAAENRTLLHIDRVDDRHDRDYRGMTPHGHYCVPIQSDGEVLGLLNLYVPEGHQSSEEKERFVTAIADSLAGIVRRRQAEDQAREHQAQLAHGARLSTMGEMATGIAHEVNQPLAAMVMYTQTCLRMIESGPVDMDEVREAMQQVAAQGLRAGDIIRRLRDFTRMKEAKRTRIEPNRLVQDAVRFIEAEARASRVGLRLDLSAGLPDVQADRIQIEQVILNLLINGVEAMEGTNTRPRFLDVRTRSNKEGAVEFSVSDTGPGLSEKAASRVFDAFFTTKRHGMGMGLSISRSIVEAHKGSLWAEQPSGPGAVFHFTLPSVSQESPVEH
ncbi:MAG: ATP-binding protein, partial [Pseudomonadota bacterium]|nr:ATP-binding protein [Pseudomonadota bacterium]